VVVVELRIHGLLMASSDTPPLVYKWPTANWRAASGTHTLDARALDAAGHAAYARLTGHQTVRRCQAARATDRGVAREGLELSKPLPPR